MQLGKELERRTEHVWDEFIGMEEDVRARFHTEMSEIILDALGNRNAEEDDLAAIRSAARLCTSRRVFGYEPAEEFTNNLIKSVRELDESKGVTKECRIFWIRVMMAALEKPYIREAAKDIKVSHLNMFFYHALEAEADEDPNRDLMTWYEEFIDRGMLYKYESRMFNRLAYFWLTAYDGQDHTDRAKAYFKAMERRGINFENPYGGFYGKSDHWELIRYLLNNEYSCKRDHYLNEYVSALADEIADGNAKESDLEDLRKTVNELHSDNHYGKNDKVTELWDKAVMNMCRALAKCCDRCEDEKYADAAGVLAECLTEWDNWLLRYIEVENRVGTEENYYSLIENWEQRISRIPGDRAWVMFSSLREILINRYNELGETDKLIKMLEKHTGDMDSATHLRDWILTEDMKGRRYCTHNTMSLIDHLIEEGDRQRAEQIIEEVAANAKDIETACCFDVSDDFRNLWLKYIILLEKHGFAEEAARWKEKLMSKKKMTEGEITCEISYLKGEYEETVRSCKENKAVKKVLEYIANGVLPRDVDMSKVETIPNKDPDSIHCRGYYVGEDMRVERQFSNAEWHKFYADMKTLSGMLDGCFKGDAPCSIYPPEYYRAELSYEPEPPIMRGDFVKYFYEHNGTSNWLGLTENDCLEIEKAVAEASK